MDPGGIDGGEMNVGKIGHGDKFRIGDSTYRAMIKQPDAWGCRRWDNGKWAHTFDGGYYWYEFDTEIEGYEKYSPARLNEGGEVDPMAR